MKTQDKEKLNKLGLEENDKNEITFSGPAKHVYNTWQKILLDIFKEEDTVVQNNPLTIKQEILDVSKYSNHFPNQLVKLKDEEYITPASCLHVYSKIDKSMSDNHESYFVNGKCARSENGNLTFPFRLSLFTMSEFVVIGDEKIVREKYDLSVKKVEDLFLKYKIKGEYRFATDAFFLAESEGARLMQKLKGLKKEFTGTTNGYDIALSSLNYHEDYFGNNFSITRDNKPAFSMCIAFGIERLTAYSLLIWGDNKNEWPFEFKYE